MVIPMYKFFLFNVLLFCIKERICIYEKIKNKSKMKSVISLVIVISIVFINSFSLVASAYGADIDDLDYACVYIRNVGSGKYMTVPDGTVSNGKEIKIYEATENKSQQWGVYKLSNGYYCIRSEIDDNYVLSVEGGNDISGAKIVLKYLSDGATIPNSAQFYAYCVDDFQCAFLVSGISNANGTARAIDCKNNEQTDGTNLVQYDMTLVIEDCVSQLWSFESYNRSIELLDWDLVDISGHCDWDCSSQYSSMVRKAANAWNDYIDDEVFRPDAWSVVQDVKIKDMDSDPFDKGAIARTFTNDIFALGENAKYASQIHLYADEMNLLSSDLQRQHTVMHELGHALGLNENRESQSDNKLGNIMQQGGLPYGTFISLDDRASVEEAYVGF